MQEDRVEMWAIVELMGHGRTAGIIRTSDLGGLLRVDVPVEDSWRTEYYGEAAIYSVKVVSEEIARAYARPEREIAIYDEPIVPRHQYEDALRASRREIDALQHHVRVLEDRLTVIHSLPSGNESSDQEEHLPI